MTFPPTIRYTIYETFLGWVLVAWTERGVCRVALDDDPEPMRQRLCQAFPQAILEAFHESTLQENALPWVSHVRNFIEQPAETLAIPVDIAGTPFQRKVWNALSEIPIGQTATYGQIAATIGHPTAVRAVAQACANNPVALIVPCHRVVGKNGKLCGYRWGVERKRLLLQQEKCASSILRTQDATKC